METDLWGLLLLLQTGLVVAASAMVEIAWLISGWRARRERLRSSRSSAR